ncbi:854_t:CDS:2 [Acaulospora morrowiae]|uniref:854_t:CDS:1 n=1 Tax=Acaulospora morrowiae TaxID=94023 RepID=A0A9N9CM20_9GLOM|nr:854_t:CDS:2 [Acaulospora morrowiae]
MILNATDYSTKSVSRYMKYFRELVIQSLEDDDTMIGGNGIVVEIDESKFSKGKKDTGIWVVGGVERTDQRKCFFKMVNQRDAETIRDIISKHVLPGSIMITNYWKGYQNLDDFNVRHERVNRSREFINSNGMHTNTIEETWKGLKIRIHPRNRDIESIDDYLLEFIWRRKYEGYLNACSSKCYPK